MERSDRRPILVVDDDENILTTIEFLLTEEGFAVSLASNGHEALAQVRQQHPCVILLDMKMPVMDGWRFAEAYRALQGPHAPIIVMTAARSPQDRAGTIAADAYIAKPFDIEQLLSLVRRHAASSPYPFC